ncbi:sphingomyelin synthase family protein [Hymenobacter lucidus]|uniref:Sphingomyelin synthase family protein n=1 Tax=Hymenobacter lucidus TaxID=2880930 RepID=A0ABS8AK72_9BACT|nr:sphingomyelin synthase family protein [Hymenobacter lucidus]MCB2406602.1 sphingomyelin synthase family protein [Hymenobacter lucidus]
MAASSAVTSSSPAPAPTWPQLWRQPAFRGRLLGILAALLLLGAVIPRFFAFIQARPGVVLPDPLLAVLPAHDVSGLTFGAIYLSVAVAVVYLVPRPALLLRALWAYGLLHLLRLLTLWLLPLEPPLGLVLLQDPLVDKLFYASATPITKDLFFSGHTATVALLALAVGPGLLRRGLWLGAVLIGGLVLVQHAHYSYDVAAAPAFAALSYWLAGRATSGASRRY